MHRFEGAEIKMLVFITETFLEKHPFFTTFLSANFFGKSIIYELCIMLILTGIRKNKFIRNKGEESLRSILNIEKKKRTIWKQFARLLF